MKKNLWLIFVIGIIFLSFLNVIIDVLNYPSWQDDVCYADITKCLIANNKLSFNMMLLPTNALIWGPVYFYVQKVFLLFFGFGLWQFRLLNFVSGIAIIFIFWLTAQKLKISKLNTFILIALIAFDLRFVFNMSSGRMDLFTLALFIIAFLLFQNSFKRNYLNIIFSGMIASIAFLSTPRIGYYFLIYILMFVIEIISSKNKKKTFIQYALLCLFILLPILIWISVSFGSITNYLNSYLNSTFFTTNIRTSIFPQAYQIPILIVWFSSCVYILKSKKNILNPFLVAIFSVPFLHLLFINEVGPYSAMMMPFVYLGIMLAINNIPNKKFSIIPGIIASIMFLFSIFSTFTNVTLEFTHPDSFRVFLKSQNISNENILSDYCFYYFINETNNRFISINDNKNELTENNLNKFGIDYAIVTKENYSKNNKIFDELGFHILKEYHTNTNDGFFYSIAKSLKNIRKKSINSGYDGFILKRNSVDLLEK